MRYAAGESASERNADAWAALFGRIRKRSKCANRLAQDIR
jgi:hypothetical protein